MKQKWNLKNVEESFELVESVEFKKIIEEVAEIVYLDFCQLRKDSFLDLLDNEKPTLEKAA